MRSALLLALGGLAFAGAATPAAAATQPVGVKAVKQGDNRVALTFSARSAARLRGRTGTLECQAFGPLEGPAIARDDGIRGSGGDVRVPRRGRTVVVRGLGLGTSDLCALILKPRVRTRPVLTVRIALTDRGVAALEEQTAAGALSLVLTVAGDAAKRRPDRSVPPSDELAREALDVLSEIRDPEIPRFGVVALAAADASPPAGSVGVFSDGAGVTAAWVTPSGRRLFIRFDAESQTTNIDALFFNYAG